MSYEFRFTWDRPMWSSPFVEGPRLTFDDSSERVLIFLVALSETAFLSGFFSAIRKDFQSGRCTPTGVLCLLSDT
jgi:hypothetical protein